MMRMSKDQYSAARCWDGMLHELEIVRLDGEPMRAALDASKLSARL